MFAIAQWIYLAAAILVAGGVASFVVWLVVHNVRYTQRDLALKAAQLASSVTVSDEQVMELLMQYIYDATGRRLVLESGLAECRPVPHIRATTMDGAGGAVLVPNGRGFTRRLEETGVSFRGPWHRLTVRNGGILMVERMRHVWASLAEGNGLSPAERLLPHSEVWRVRFFVHSFPVKRRRPLRWVGLRWRAR